MWIAGNAVRYPQRVVGNDEVCQLVRLHTPGASALDTQGPIPEVRKYLEHLGAEERRWLSRSERPIDLIRQAAEASFEQSGLDRGAIDNLIYCGVDRPLVEPASAAFVAFELGMIHTRAFDVVHACQGWFTALQIAGDRADFHGETTLIVSAEFPMNSGGAAYPKNFDLSDIGHEKWKLATLVLGEAAAATIVAPGGDPLDSRQRSNSAGYRASYVRLPGAERFLTESDAPFEVPEITFFSNAEALVEHGMGIAFAAFDALGADEQEPIVVVPHTISSRLIAMLRRRHRDRFPIVNVFPVTGNIGTASLAAGLDWLQHDPKGQQIRAHRRAVGWMVAAGMTAVAFRFPAGAVQSLDRDSPRNPA